jgi:2',3'-cyclic-nucleotide 2'-phosphodiesterase
MGSPAAAISAGTERAGGGTADGFAACGDGCVFDVEFRTDGSGVNLPPVMPEVFCIYTILFYHYNSIMKMVRAAMIGDVVGEPGIKVLEDNLPRIIKDNVVDFIVVNGENAADGFGMTEVTLKRMLACGVDVVTSGNHIWEKREFWPFIDPVNKILRPANYSGNAPGRGWLCTEKAGANWIIINLQGRELMTPIDCPFRCFDNIINESAMPADTFPVIMVDFHAESSREKEALGHYLDGRAALLAGTHTHVQTADDRILPKGTAYITDLGMTGITNSVIGMDTKICLDRTRKQVLYRMEPAVNHQAGDKCNGEVQGIIAEIDTESGKAVSIRRI